MLNFKHFFFKYRWYLVALILIITLIKFWPSHSKANDNVIAVTVVQAVVGNLAPQIDAIGTAQALNSTTIKSLVQGQLRDILVNPGQTVKAGDVLFRLDAAPYEALFNQAEATTKKDQATMTYAKEELKRYTKLAEQGYVSKDFFAQILANAKTAQAQFIADLAAQDKARHDLEQCTIYAPISGKLGDIAPNVGDIIGVNDTTPMVVINQLSPIEVRFSLPANQVPLIHQMLAKNPHTQITATSTDDPTLHTTGTINFIDNQIDNSTGSIILKAAFPNPDQAILPGQLLQVQLQGLAENHVLLIPNEALSQDRNNQFYVFVIDTKNKAHLRVVTIGTSVDGKTAIHTGLNAGEKVVTKGQFRLAEDTSVKIIHQNASE
jgi:membrane fusion protein, multidrug efflux system